MRKLILTLAPAIALAALPAFAQSSVTTNESTTTTGTTQAPYDTQTTTNKETRTDEGAPIAENRESRSYERKTTTDGVNSSTEVEKHRKVEGADGSYSESHSSTSSTGPQ